METIKVRYKWKSHTIVKIDWEEKKVLEWEVIEVKENTKKHFLYNWFEVVGSRNIELLQEEINCIKKELKDEEERFLTLEKWIKEKAQQEIENYKKLSEDRKISILNRISWIEDEIKQQEEVK
jgi:hypothetical protein